MEIQKRRVVVKEPQSLPRWLPWFHAALLALTIWFWWTFLHNATLHGYVYKRDFASVYVGARAVSEGLGSQLYDLEVQRKIMDAAILPYHRKNLLPYIYPAYVAVLFSPLGAISLDKAFLIWTGINLVVTAWMARRVTQYVRGSLIEKLAILVVFFAWVPLQLTLSHGQLGLPCALAITETILSLQVRRQWRAGWWLALALLKPQILLLPLLALLIWRCWRTLASFAAAVVLVAGVSFAKVGFWIAGYLRFIVEFNGRGAEVSLYPRVMQNWRGLVACLLANDKSFAAQFLLVVLSAASLVAVVLVCYRWGAEARRDRTSPSRWEARFAIAVLLGILSSPYLYPHDWVVAVPALIVLYCLARDLSAEPEKRSRRVAVVLLWLLALAPFVAFAAQFDFMPGKSPIQLVAWYMGMLTFTAVLAVRRAGEGGSVPIRA